MVGGTDNNQLKGAAEETTVAAMATVTETVMAMETATVTTAIRTPMPTTLY